MAGSAAMLLERMDADRLGEAEAPGLRWTPRRRS